MTLKDALLASQLGGGSGGGGMSNVVFIRTDVTINGDGEYDGGFYKEDGDLYTYEEMLALHNSGATLLAYYDEWPVSYIEVGDNGDDSYYFSAAVESTHDGFYYDVYLTEDGYDLDCGELDTKPLMLTLSKQGSPSSLTGDDIFICDHQFPEIMKAMQGGREVIGVLVQGYAEQRMLPMVNAVADQYFGVTFRDIYFIDGGNLGWEMDVLTIEVNNKNGGTHTHSEHRRYALTSL